MEPSADEDGGGERGRAEQKGRVNRDINSQRLMLLGRRHGRWRLEMRGDAHSLMAAFLRDGIELFLKRTSK